MEDKLKSVVRFWGLWLRHKKNGGKYSELTKIMKKNSSFEQGIKEIESLVLNIDYNIFSKGIDTDIEEFEKQIKIIEQTIRERKINVITHDQFALFKSFKNIKNSLFFFYRGDVNILNDDPSDFVSIVGSRKTPDKYINWIEKVVPYKNIVSGLANGADVMGHQWAIKNNLKIVVFPGTDIYNLPKKGPKNLICQYALHNGLILSDIFPGSKSFDKSIFLKRNRWMAQLSNESYLMYFDGISGTLGQALEMAKLEKSIFMPKDVLARNKNFLEEHKNFNLILDYTGERY